MTERFSFAERKTFYIFYSYCKNCGIMSTIQVEEEVKRQLFAVAAELQSKKAERPRSTRP